MSVHPRLRRLFAADGACFDVAIDHGFFNEASFLAGIEDIGAAVTTIVDAAPDAIQLTVGQAHHLQDRPGAHKPALVLRTDVANVYGKTLPNPVFSQLIADPVEQAVRLDAACVVVNLFLIPKQATLYHQCLANIAALKSLGVEWILSVSAVGSLREDYAPLHLVIPDQLVDRTKCRPNSFFADGMVAHVSFADPFCSATSDLLEAAIRDLGDIPYHRGGVYVCIEGPQFSTKAESRLYRQWGCDIIGMTALPEAKLAREAEICYATIACVTDYDVWHASEEAVSLELVVANLTRNVANAQRILRAVAARLPADRADATCDCSSALANALITDPSYITADLRKKYALLLGKYL